MYSKIYIKYLIIKKNQFWWNQLLFTSIQTVNVYMELNNLSGYGTKLGDLGRGGLVAVFVGDVLDGVDESVRADVWELAADLQGFVLGTNVVYGTSSSGELAVAGLVADQNISIWK